MTVHDSMMGAALKNKIRTVRRSHSRPPVIIASRAPGAEPTIQSFSIQTLKVGWLDTLAKKREKSSARRLRKTIRQN